MYVCTSIEVMYVHSRATRTLLVLLYGGIIHVRASARSVYGLIALICGCKRASGCSCALPASLLCPRTHTQRRHCYPTEFCMAEPCRCRTGTGYLLTADPRASALLIDTDKLVRALAVRPRRQVWVSFHLPQPTSLGFSRTAHSSSSDHACLNGWRILGST